jgi:HD-GYP domain-containing protein (c-di-GMP phosphodiesterase class II)
MMDTHDSEPTSPKDLETLREELARSRRALREMSKVGMALMGERDPVVLFELILTQARGLTSSDAGSLYLVEKDEDGNPLLHFIASQTDTHPNVPSPTFRLPLNEHSIAGYAATNGRPLLLDDVYELPSDVPFSFNREVYDEKYGYRAKSMLVVPMIDYKEKVVGVLQLINRKSDPAAKIHTDEDSDRWVLPYTDREVDIVTSLAGQAAVAIENGRLYQDIENLFAGFIKAAVTAIDRRDPTTSGHSVRVTELTCAVAELVNEQTEGPFSDASFSDEEMKQLRYAGLLHDFGKIGVREETLIKQNKLSPVLGAQVDARFSIIRITLRLEAAQEKVDAIAASGAAVSVADCAAIEA